MRLVWDEVGKRKYEAGVDRGVLYLPDGLVVPWNGLTAVEENIGDSSVTSYHYDGIKYADKRTPGDFSAVIKALYYPDEFAEFEGMVQTVNRMQLGQQPIRNYFNLAYRTLIGNDTDGVSHGYKIHILYNLTANPSNRTHNVMGREVAPSDFAWDVVGVPEVAPGYRPTAHVTLDTTLMSKYLIRELEAILYGTGAPITVEAPSIEVVDGGTPESAGDDFFDGGDPFLVGAGVYDGGTPRSSDEGEYDDDAEITIDPMLPSLAQLTTFVEDWVLIDITDHGDGTWSAKAHEDFITMLDETTFQITSANATYLDEDTYVLSDTINEEEV